MDAQTRAFIEKLLDDSVEVIAQSFRAIDLLRYPVPGASLNRDLVLGFAIGSSIQKACDMFIFKERREPTNEELFQLTQIARRRSPEISDRIFRELNK